jgi:hypothetical protein
MSVESLLEPLIRDAGGVTGPGRLSQSLALGTMAERQDNRLGYGSKSSTRRTALLPRRASALPMRARTGAPANCDLSPTDFNRRRLRWCEFLNLLAIRRSATATALPSGQQFGAK